jgi:hypothetical protein
MRRDFYLHTRHQGIFYAEFVDPETGRKLPARSTGERDRDKALLKIAIWKANGLPDGRMRRPRPLEVAAGLDVILKSIRKTDLNGDDALRIVNALKGRGPIDIGRLRLRAGERFPLCPVFSLPARGFRHHPSIR